MVYGRVINVCVLRLTLRGQCKMRGYYIFYWFLYSGMLVSIWTLSCWKSLSLFNDRRFLLDEIFDETLFMKKKSPNVLMLLSTIFLKWYFVKWNSKICANFDAFSLMEHFIKHKPLTSEECFLWTQISPQILWNYHLGLASWNSAPCYLYK